VDDNKWSPDLCRIRRTVESNDLFLTLCTFLPLYTSITESLKEVRNYTWQETLNFGYKVGRGGEWWTDSWDVWDGPRTGSVSGSPRSIGFLWDTFFFIGVMVEWVGRLYLIYISSLCSGGFSVSDYRHTRSTSLRYISIQDTKLQTGWPGCGGRRSV
jgi:hypothetical protein